MLLFATKLRRQLRRWIRTTILRKEPQNTLTYRQAQRGWSFITLTESAAAYDKGNYALYPEMIYPLMTATVFSLLTGRTQSVWLAMTVSMSL